MRILRKRHNLLDREVWRVCTIKIKPSELCLLRRMLAASRSRVLNDDLAYTLIAFHVGQWNLLIDLVERGLLLIRLRHEVKCLAHRRLKLYAETAELAVYLLLEPFATQASGITGLERCLIAIGASGLDVRLVDLGLGDGGVDEDLRVHPQI